jgi:hypothetical protein
LFRKAPAAKRKVLLGEDAPKAQSAWKDPWETKGIG